VDRYALTVKEVQMILKQRCVLVDGRARTDTTFPTGFMDVISIPKTRENFRLVFDAKGRYVPLPIDEEEAKVCLHSARACVCYPSVVCGRARAFGVAI
jgi:small subunit ribosomal protein S4e